MRKTLFAWACNASNFRTSFLQPIRPTTSSVSPSFPLVASSSLSQDDNPYIFKKSGFDNLRMHRYATRSKTKSSNDESQPQTTQSVSNSTSNSTTSISKQHSTLSDIPPGTFESHDQLLDAYSQLTEDPLEKDGGRVVVYRGSPNANLMIIGEAPGEQEDLQEKPFVGRAGQLLDKIFTYAGFHLERQIYVTNICKRRPKANRTPTKDEVQFYMPYLHEEIRLVNPSLIVLAGSVPAQALLGDVRITQVRGQWFDLDGYKVMPVFHPSYLLRNPAAKYDMVKDIEAIREMYLQLNPDDELAPLQKQQ